MSLFKAFWRIIKKNWISVLIYFGIAFGIAIMFLVMGQGGSAVSDTSIEKVTVGIITEESSGFGDALARYARKTFDTDGVKDINASGEEIKEILYSGVASYVIVIDGDEVSDYQTPNNMTAIVAQSHINNYINTYKSMEKLYPDSSADRLAELTEKNLQESVSIEDLSVTKTGARSLNDYFNIFVYGAFGTLVMCIGVAMMAMNERKMYMRTAVSPISIRRRNTVLFSAQVLFGAAVWLFGAVGSLFFAGDALFTPVHIMYLVNSIPFVLSITAIGFVVGQIVKNETVFSGVSTVLMLSISFLSGVFIPQEFLADSVLKISASTPAYWFVLNNNKISEMSGYDWGALTISIIVMCAFTAALALAGTAVTVIKARKKLA